MNPPKLPRMKARPDATRPYEEIIRAIVVQAAVDYIKAWRMKQTTADIATASQKIEEVEKFFHSKHFTKLTNLDGKEVLKKIKEIYL